jgi:hypothetical protein
MYNKNDPFQDPVLRCDGCKKIIRREEIQKTGSCTCGHKKVANLMSFNLREYLRMRYLWRIDPEFLAMFTSKGGDECVEKASI